MTSSNKQLSIHTFYHITKQWLSYGQSVDSAADENTVVEIHILKSSMIF